VYLIFEATVMPTRPTIHHPTEREVHRVRGARGDCGRSMGSKDTVVFGKNRSVSDESRMGTGRGTKNSCFSGSFGMVKDAISI
jgi:hypothetical protein